MTIYNKSTRDLMFDAVRELSIQKGQPIDRRTVLQWFATKYPLIKRGTVEAHLVRMTTNAPARIHHYRSTLRDDLFFREPNGALVLYQPERHPAPITPESINSQETQVGGDSFAFEKDLQNFLARKLTVIEPGLRLYEDDGLDGIEFPAGGRYIDILAIDARNALVVIELKVSRGYDRVVGQLLRYMNWVKHNVAEDEQHVRGIIIAREISEDLRLASEALASISLFEYDLSVSHKRVASSVDE